MSGMWIVQLLFDLLVLLGGAFLLARQRRVLSRVLKEKLAQLSAAFEAHVNALEVQAKAAKDRMSGQLQALSRICDEASRLLRKAELQAELRPSEEESELALSLHNREIRDAIPRLQDLDKARQRLNSEIALDLRTLLKDQLA